MLLRMATMVEPDIRVEFHANVFKLFNISQEPCEPVNYRGREYVSTDEYPLLHEEEQHLADGIAVLAQTKGGPGRVSAVTVEFSKSPPTMVIRLASNETPTPESVNGLRQVLDTVSEYSRAGSSRETFHARLFDQILKLSSVRLSARVSSLRTKPAIRPGSNPTKGNFKSRKIDGLLTRMSFQNANPPAGTLHEHLMLLGESLNDSKHPKNRMQMLRDIVRQSWGVSNFNNAKSLETQLQALGMAKELYQCRAVLDIDKISQYLDICNDLMRFSRRKVARPFFINIRLETCIAPETVEVPGARIECRVHGEVQLVLYHEQNPSPLPPRCIGSSKSACYLCDLFIEKHGGYYISHSHKRLYEKWTVPNPTWMTPDQAARLENILRAMNKELLRQIGLKRPKRTYASSPESRAHLLLLPNGAYVASPVASVISHAQPLINGVLSSDRAEASTSIPKASTPAPKPSTSTLTLRTTTPEGPPLISTYRLHNLPLSIPFSKPLTSSVLKVGVVTYILDLEDVSSGHIQISEHIHRSTHREMLRVNARDPILDSILSLRDSADERILTFCVHDDERWGLEIVVRWS